MAKLTTEQMKNVDSYDKDITHIEGTINAIRKLPGMYIGPVGFQGTINMFREIFQNSVDQMLFEKSPCNYISILFDERYTKFIIRDKRLGITFLKCVEVFSE